ncbi:MAG: hypothetical protein QOE90_2810 [Thermoplasmata archaeon]|jgi:hypothetical protein|nr:hypothetical protein [Thermoplasmata archaeon]
MRSRILLATVILGLALPVLPFARGGEGSASLSLSGSGPVWISARIANPSGPVDVTLRIELSGAGGEGGSAFTNGHWRSLDAAVALWDDPGILVHAGEPNGQGLPIVHFDSRAAPDEPGFMEGTWSFPPGETSFVIWAAGTVQSWSFQTSAPSDAALVALDQGTSAYFRTSHDFHGPLSVDAAQTPSAPVAGDVPVMARASASASTSLAVQHELVGFFSSKATDALSVFEPSGSHVAAGVNGGAYFSWSGDPQADMMPNGPGGWAFEDTGAGAGVPTTAETYLFVADAPVLRG